MKSKLSRRDFVGLLGLGLNWPLAARLAAADVSRNFRIRTITAGVQIENISQLEQAETAVTFLKHARGVFENAGYEVQTVRMATQPLQEYLPDWSSVSSLEEIKVLDQFAVDQGVVCSIGPVITEDHVNPAFASWAAELIQQTKNTSFTCRVASAERGIYHQAIRSAAEAIHAITRATPGGEGNFNFAATAFIPSGTPFFPAAWFDQGNTFSIGLESPNLLSQAFEGA